MLGLIDNKVSVNYGTFQMAGSAMSGVKSYTGYVM
jgi:hypothetical protein